MVKAKFSGIPATVSEEGGPYPCTVRVKNETGKRVEQPNGSVDIDPRAYTFKITVSLKVNGTKVFSLNGVVDCQPAEETAWSFEFVPHAAGQSTFTATLLDSYNNVVDEAVWAFEILQGWWKEPIRATLVLAEAWSS